MQRRYVNQVSDAFRRYREENKINATELGKRLGLSALGVEALESGMQRPSFRTLRVVARVFQWQPGEVGVIVLSLPDHRSQFYTEEPDGGGRRADRASAAAAEEGKPALVGDTGQGDQRHRENGAGAGV